MERQENREVTVRYCDLCKKETDHLRRCAVCKREMCTDDGGKKHTAYHVEVYQYGDAQRFTGDICVDCVKEKINLTIRQLFEGMMGRGPVLAKKQP